MQKFTSKEVKLKNGKLVVIREAEVEDAEKLLDCIKTYIPESDFIPKLEEEIKMTVEQEREWIRTFSVQENSLVLVAEYEGQIIGNIDLAGNQHFQTQHF
jgi:N-acetylglutamate synthase-like GNAT family acetyltransferase